MPPRAPYLTSLADQLTQLVDGRLWLQVLIAMFLGLATGVVIGPGFGWLEPETGIVVGNWLAFPGKLFLATIQMIVIPLVFASIVTGLNGGGDVSAVKRLGIWVSGFFVISTAISAFIGIQLAVFIEPGSYLSIGDQVSEIAATDAAPTAAEESRVLHALPEMVVGLLPINPLNAMVEGQMVQIVLFALIFGIALLTMTSDKSRPLIELLRALQEVCMSVVRWAMMLAPYAVFGLMAQLTSRTGWQTLLGLGVYVITVLLGLLLLMMCYLIFLRLIAREPPLAFLRSTRELLLLAFSTSSSAAVMPLSMKTAIDKFRVRNHVAQFVIPLGATINMNGTALYQSVAAVFLAQVFQVELGMGGIALIVVTAVGASIGSPATPGVGIVILAGILSGVGVPAAGVALIVGVDRILDMARTAVNVSGDLVTSIFVDRWVLGEDETPLEPETEPDPAASQETLN